MGFEMITEYSDLEEFQQLKQKCWSAAERREQMDLSGMEAPEYKYFSELYKVYTKLLAGEITKDEGIEQEKRLYKELVKFQKAYLGYITAEWTFRENEKKVSPLLCELYKSNDLKEISVKACRCISLLNNESSFAVDMEKKIGGLK